MHLCPPAAHSPNASLVTTIAFPITAFVATAPTATAPSAAPTIPALDNITTSAATVHLATTPAAPTAPALDAVVALAAATPLSAGRAY